MEQATSKNMSVLDRATEEEVFAFNCDRSTCEIALKTIQSQDYREAFDQFIKYVLDTVQNLILDYDYGECEFNIDWKEYQGLFPYDLPIFSTSVADANIYDWIEKTVLVQANSVLRFIKVSISLDEIGGFVGYSDWRSNTLCFVMDERRSQERVE